MELSPAGYQTPGNNFKSKLSPELGTEFENILGGDPGARWSRFSKKAEVENLVLLYVYFLIFS
jgi:hypothetical protein